MSDHRTRPPDGAFDVVVVGGGVIGLTAARDLAARGASVALVERDRIGAGASGVAAGMLAPVGEAHFGEEALLGLNLASHRMWPAFAQELEAETGLDIGYRATGAIHVALDRDEAERLRRLHDFQGERGLAIAVLLPRDARRLEPGLAPGLTAAAHAVDEASVDPAALLEALARSCEARGVSIVEGEEAAGLELAGDRVSGVLGSSGRRFAADSVLVATGCTGAASDWLPSGARVPVRPVKGQLLRLRGPRGTPLCERIVVTERVYVVPRGDGRVVVGATMEERGTDGRVTAGAVHELLREARRALPDIDELELVEAVAGFRPATPDNLPVIGRGRREGLLLATGHFRNGVLQAPLTAAAISALVEEREPDGAVAGLGPERFAPERISA